jgi:ribosome maturation factor RimP
MEGLAQQIETWVLPKLEELDCFLVDVRVKPSGTKVEVYIDSDNGLPIGTCEQVSRFLEFHLDSAPGIAPTYNLEVSSPGMDNPFKVDRQYKKQIGKMVEVLLHDGVKKEGMLMRYDGVALDVQIKLPVKKKKDTPETVTETFLLKDIKHTKKLISF